MSSSCVFIKRRAHTHTEGQPWEDKHGQPQNLQRETQDEHLRRLPLKVLAVEPTQLAFFVMAAPENQCTNTHVED